MMNLIRYIYACAARLVSMFLTVACLYCVFFCPEVETHRMGLVCLAFAFLFGISGDIAAVHAEVLTVLKEIKEKLNGPRT